MLEKGEGFAVGVFPEGLVLLLVNFTDTHISHHAQQLWGVCKGYVGGCYTGLCPRYGGLFH